MRPAPRPVREVAVRAVRSIGRALGSRIWHFDPLSRRVGLQNEWEHCSGDTKPRFCNRISPYLEQVCIEAQARSRQEVGAESDGTKVNAAAARIAVAGYKALDVVEAFSHPGINSVDAMISEKIPPFNGPQ